PVAYLLPAVRRREIAVDLPLVIGWEGALVRSDQHPGGRIVDGRQVIKGNVSFPFVLAVAAAHWELAGKAVADGEASGRLVTDVAFAIRIHEVLARTGILAQRLAELLPVGCLIDLRKREPELGVGGRPLHRILLAALGEEDGAVTRDPYRHVHGPGA